MNRSTQLLRQSESNKHLWNDSLFSEGHADTWNHTEAAMALSTAGLRAAAEQAFDWLARTQRSDGSWHHYYLSDGLEDAKVQIPTAALTSRPVCYIIFL